MLIAWDIVALINYFLWNQNKNEINPYILCLTVTSGVLALSNVVCFICRGVYKKIGGVEAVANPGGGVEGAIARPQALWK